MRFGSNVELGSSLEAAGALLQQISNLTGTPGFSVGVLHQGEVVHTASYGWRDVGRRVVPDEDTSWLICSLTKAFTASMVGMLVDEGRLAFTTQLRDLLPDYRRSDAQAAVTVEDLLSHRTGLAPYDGLWLASDNQIHMPRSEAVPLLSRVPAASPLRTRFLYSNMAFEALGQVVEKVTGRTYREVLHERITGPLNLSRTFYAEEPLDDNTARSYVVLANRSFHEVPPWGHGRDLLIGAAGAIRSSVADLLVVYRAVMDAANSQVPFATHNPFKQQKELLEAKVGVGSATVREYSSASGWLRAQLPNLVNMFADYDPPVLGAGAGSRLMVYHQGRIAGSVGYVALFPETTTAVVVLANSAGFTDAVRLLGQILVETVFNNSGRLDKDEYLEIARTSRQRSIGYVDSVYRAIMDGKNASVPARALSAYAGRYHSSIGNYLIEIREAGGRLEVAFGGRDRDRDTFGLEPYQTDSFFWWLDYDESATRTRLPGFPKEYFILAFGCPGARGYKGDREMRCLTWKHEFSVPGEGEIFRKRRRSGHLDGVVMHQQDFGDLK